MPRKSLKARVEETPRRSTRISSKPLPAVVSSGRKRKAGAGDTASSSKKKVALAFFFHFTNSITDLTTVNSMTSQAKPDVDENAAQAPGETNKVTGEVEVEEKFEVIDIGGSLPSVMLKNEKGEDVDVAGLAAEKGVVMFLVPKADTPGCTTQACGFRDSFPDYTSLGFDVYCLSADASTAQAKWQGKRNLPYSLLSDPKRILIGALGAADGNHTKRSHFIFAKGGQLIDKKLPVKPVDSPRLALEFIQKLAHESGAKL